MKAIIVDDEKNSREVLGDLVRELHPEIHVIGEASNAEDAYELIQAKQPELVFLDIQMPGGNGFSLLKRFDKIPFNVIFVTSYDNYAINAIKFSALDYLQKPIEISELRIAIEKALAVKKLKDERDTKIVNLLNNVDAKGDDRKIVVHAHDKVKLLTVDKIMYIEADDSYCDITMQDGGKYTTSKFLKDFEEFLTDNKKFIRIHKSVMINIAHIEDYSKGEPCIIAMEDGKKFEVARRKKQEILEKIKM